MEDHFNLDGVEYFRLHIPCPTCIDRGTPTLSSHWTHLNCGGNMYVGDNACFYCSRCHVVRSVYLWAFSCPNHPYRMLGAANYNMYESHPDFSLTILGEITRCCPTETRFMRKFVANLDDWVTEHPNGV